MVKYDTIIKLEPQPGLKPGMSAVVDVVLEQYEDELLIPVAAILQSEDEYVCWVTTANGIQRRTIQLSGSDDEFTVVTAGLVEGDEVVLNPLAYLDEAQQAALKPAGSKPKSGASETDAETAADRETQKPDGERKNDQQARSASSVTRGQIIRLAAGNADGARSEDEFSKNDCSQFSKADTNGDGEVDAAEVDAAESNAEIKVTTVG
jgi:hypothetical protein